MAGRRFRGLVTVGVFVLGVVVGALLFSKTQRRSLLAVTECDHCMTPNEISGLVASVLVQQTPGVIPKVLETERTLVVRHPVPQARHHYVLLPKRDIRNIGRIARGDEEYVVDLMAVAARLVNENKMSEYRLWTNGPGEQAVGYLHFHLAGK